MPNEALPRVLSRLEGDYQKHVGILREFVAIPSVSTDPSHAVDVRLAVNWVATQMRKVQGMTVSVEETGGHPVVIGAWGNDPQRPTVLVYGHADVQPPDPLDAWRSPPFELTERDGRWYARGISDDKASMLTPILVAQACGAEGLEPPVNLRFLFEAEEEVGSPNLAVVVDRHRHDLACDVVVSADGGMWREERPCLTVSARGLVGLELTVRGPSKDLHSGRHGGGVANPLHALAELVASLHENGKVAVDGFYDSVEDPSDELLQATAALSFDEAEYCRAVGEVAFGEPGYSTLVRQWYRPTLEVNGVWGGYQGPGSKTVIPSEAHAKITCRLVPAQDPTVIANKLIEHLEHRLPPGTRLEVRSGDHSAWPYRVAHGHPALTIAGDVLHEVFNGPVDVVGMGGSIPICSTFLDVLGADTIFFSFSTADEDIHAPNEFYRPERFRAGLEAWARLWWRLADMERR